MSSTFANLKAERHAVEQVIHRMGDLYEGMEHFGSFPQTPLQECLDRVRNADIVVLVIGFRHGHVPRRRKRSMTEREYWEAKQNDIPILTYVADREAYTVPEDVNPRLEEFRAFLRENHGAPCFRSPADLASQVAADLGRYIRRELTRVGSDAQLGRAQDHLRVVAALERGDIELARSLNEQLLRNYRDSPRAHYNHACILSRMAENEVAESAVRMRLLRQAVSRLSDALKYGILQFINLYSDRSLPENNNPPERIIGDRDLMLLFETAPSVADKVRSGFIPMYGCGC